MMDSRDALLRRWTGDGSAVLTDEFAGRLAVAVVACSQADELAGELAPEAERLAFAAIWQILRPHPLAGWRERPAGPPPGLASALSILETVQEWSTMTGRSPFAAGLSRDATEALARYEAASLCDRIAEEHEIGDRASVTCWYQAAHREAFRAVMRRPRMLSGEDKLPEEMLRIAAAAHIARLSREPNAARVFGADEVAGLPTVEAAVRRSSRRAIDQQKANNRLLLGQASR